MKQYHSNKNHILADQIRSEEINGLLEPVTGAFTVSHNVSEAEYSFSRLHPELIIIDRGFFRRYSTTFEKISHLSPSLKFIPVVYLGSTEDPDYTDLSYFGRVICADMDNITGIVKDLLSPSVKIKFWGVRGSTPCPNYEKIHYGGNTSCVQIEKTGMESVLILDSGTGIRNLGNYLSLEKSKITGRIFITHPHWDHIQGFPFFKPFYSKRNSFSIHLPGQLKGGAQDILSGHLTKTFFPITLDMLAADLVYQTQDEQQVYFDDYSIEYMVANHPTKTAVYKVRIGGYTIIYCPDNELPLKSTPLRFLDKFEAFIQGCDVLIHDAQYSLSQYETKTGWGHSAWERVVEIAKRSEVKKLFLTHHDPDSNDHDLAKIDEQLSSYIPGSFEEASLTKEGIEIRLALK
ncbi:MAG: MBL fold metallo-hydrolase [Balneolaceae bacterium]